jgi:hypothetical protein
MRVRVGEDIAYPRLMEIIRAAGASPRWDETQRAWVAMWEARGVFEHAWIEDARAFEAKLQLVRQHGAARVTRCGCSGSRIRGPGRSWGRCTAGNARGVSR